MKPQFTDFKRDTIEFPATAAGQNALIVVPEDPGLWCVVMGMRFIVTTSVAVANRIVQVQLQQSPKPTRVLAEWTVQVNNLAIGYTLNRDTALVQPGAVSGANCFFPLGYNASEAGLNINIIVTNRDPGDVISAGYLEMFRVPFEALPLWL